MRYILNCLWMWRKLQKWKSFIFKTLLQCGNHIFCATVLPVKVLFLRKGLDLHDQFMFELTIYKVFLSSLIFLVVHPNFCYQKILRNVLTIGDTSTIAATISRKHTTTSRSKITRGRMQMQPVNLWVDIWLSLKRKLKTWVLWKQWEQD